MAVRPVSRGTRRRRPLPDVGHVASLEVGDGTSPVVGGIGMSEVPRSDRSDPWIRPSQLENDSIRRTLLQGLIDRAARKGHDPEGIDFWDKPVPRMWALSQMYLPKLVDLLAASVESGARSYSPIRPDDFEFRMTSDDGADLRLVTKSRPVVSGDSATIAMRAFDDVHVAVRSLAMHDKTPETLSKTCAARMWGKHAIALATKGNVSSLREALKRLEQLTAPLGQEFSNYVRLDVVRVGDKGTLRYVPIRSCNVDLREGREVPCKTCPKSLSMEQVDLWSAVTAERGLIIDVDVPTVAPEQLLEPRFDRAGGVGPFVSLPVLS